MKKGLIICGFLLLIACLVTTLPPQQANAQEGKKSLDLQLSARTYYNQVTPGKDNIFFFEVRNNGTLPITNIVFSSYQPEGWVIDFNPGKIDQLSPGSSQTLDANVKPGDKTTRGQYRVTVIATAAETRTVSDMWLTVETPRGVWLWVGVILAVVVIAAFIVIFMRYGRH